MADRKSILGPAPEHPELDRLLADLKDEPVTEDELAEQQISFAYGNAPHDANISKEWVREVSRHLLRPSNG